ncbi:hypothetical protein ASPZODRAFT_29198 [Penicilliopsis zonata CBS 506.65]|uniref:Zn(2)-C6 fungal-type domain-containing protein n=1 Tax=Penicilliopsis zonata CBS 506.65 TaxID=1073090 RepID=A0A1L9S5P1_9EURO|nr:hypothetical protein ASPZODRAFT_29198 [Penicilliopsis zonata CBS 506.65]OJJ42470.1 hypothetical protein ASPZODRAFT_29198 [Penicilliopsis zonata CBS 506.65]
MAVQEDKATRRHCWTCRQRRLVCDFTRPACRRCTADGRACPGYAAVKPVRLEWLVPGRISSRGRRQQQQQQEEEQSRNGCETSLLAQPQVPIDSATAHVLEAAEYYNTCIGPTVEPMMQVAPGLGVVEISPSVFHRFMAAPDYVRQIVVCSALGHRLCRSRYQNSPATAMLEQRFFRSRGLMIASLHDDIDANQLCDRVIVGIIALLVIDVRQGISHHSWRHHLEGIRRIIKMRGGQQLCASLGVVPSLLQFLLGSLAVLGDTTSPASDMAIRPDHLVLYNFLVDRYAARHDLFTMFPAPLFTETIRINYLRMRAAHGDPDLDPGLRIELRDEAEAILGRLYAFSPEKWAQSRSSFPSPSPPPSTTYEEDCQLIGRVYQTAVILYAIPSLQSVSVLPYSPLLSHDCTALCQRLHTLLQGSLSSPKFQRLLFWPLIVLGVHASKENPDTPSPHYQSFVRRHLHEIGRFTGTYNAQAALDVLDRFWPRGGGWDDCFDRPYLLYSSQGVDGRGLKD